MVGVFFFFFMGFLAGEKKRDALTRLTCSGETPNNISGFLGCMKAPLLARFLKRISFHFALPPAGLRAEG